MTIHIKPGVMIHADQIDNETMAQLIDIIHINENAFKPPIALMPDCHAGSGCLIGFTAKMGEFIFPDIIGNDIGCGVMVGKFEGLKIKDFNPDLLALFDRYLRESIGTLNGLRTCSPGDGKSPILESELSKVRELRKDMDNHWKIKGKPIYPNSVPFPIGSLGGGNHFIELGCDDLTDNVYIIIHSGSRDLGGTVHKFFVEEAKSFNKKIGISPRLPILNPAQTDDYLYRQKQATEFAHLNRMIMMKVAEMFFKPMDCKIVPFVDSVHNYIELEPTVSKDPIIRKGAISAKKDEKVVIPLSMSTGCILGVGKGVSKYNFSAPHGAGRKYSRSAMKQMLADGSISVEGEIENMASLGIWTSSINESTIDETENAYKSLNEIESHLKETVDIKVFLRPIYNIKG